MSAKTILRRIGKVAKWTLLGLTAALLLLLLFLHTGWGRDYARDKIADEASESFPGTLQIGALEGSVLGEPVFKEIVLSSPDKKEVLRLGSVNAGLRLFDLLSGAITIDKLAIVGMHLNLVQDADGKLNLLESLIDPDAPESTDPWPVHLRGLSIAKSSIDFTDASGTKTSIKNLSLKNLDVSIANGSTNIALQDLEFDLPMCAGERAKIQGALTISETGIAAEGLRITVSDGSVVALQTLTLATDLSELQATLSAKLTPELLGCLEPNTSWLAPIAFEANASKTKDQANIGFDLLLADKSFAVSEGYLSIDANEIGAKLELHQLQPGRTIAIAPFVEATGNFEMKVDRAAPGGLQVDLSGEGSAMVDDYAFSLSELTLVNQGKLASLSVALSGYQGGVALGTIVDWGQDPIVIREGELKAEIPNLSALPFIVPVSGGVELSETTFSGPIDALEVKGLLAGRALRHQETRLRTVALNFHFTQLPDSLAGKIRLDAQGVRQGREFIGSVGGRVDSDTAGEVFQLKLTAGQPERLSAYLDAELVSELGRHEFTFRALRLRHKALQASLRRRAKKPARLTLWPGGSMQVEDMLLSLGDGSLLVEGSLESGLRGTLRNLELTPILALAPEFTMPLTATIDGEIVARESAKGVVTTLSLETDSLKLSPESESLRMDLSATLEGDRVSTKIELGSEANGGLRVSASGRLPSGPTNNIARHLRAAEIELDNLNLKLLRPLAPELASVGGLVQGKLTIGGGVSKIEGELTATELSHKSFRSKRSVKLKVDAGRSEAEVGLSLRDSAIGAAHLVLRLRPPGPLHSPWLWPRSLNGVLRDSELEIEPLDLVAIKRAFPSLDPEDLLQAGTLSGKLRLRDQGKTLDLSLTASKVRAADLPPLSGTLATNFKRNSTGITWLVTADSNNQVSGEATVGIGLAALEKHTTLEHLLKTLQSTGIDATASARTNSPALWSELAGSKSRLPIAGYVRASATLQGTIQKPSGSVNVDISGANVDGVALQLVSLVATLKKQQAEATLSIAQTKNRKAVAAVLFDLETQKLRRGSIDAKDIDLRLIRALDKTGEGILSSIAGVANGKLEVIGHWDSPEPAGSMRVRDGAIDLGGSVMPIVGLSLDIKAEDRRLTVSGKAESGSGRINISGSSKVSSQGLEDIAVRLRTSKVPLVIASLVCSLDLDSHSQIVLKPGLVDIKTKVDNALVRIPVRSFTAGTRSLHSLDGMSDLVYVSPTVEDEDQALDQSGTLVRLRILARDTVEVRAKVMQATLGLDLDTTFIDDKVVVNGGATVASGHIDLFARRYVIEKASASFRGRVPVNPSFNFRLRHDFDQLALSILGSGDLDDQNITFIADPANYDQTTLLAIVLGQAPAQNEQQTGLRGDNALSALSTYAANKVQELLAPILPFDLDVLRIENTDNDGYLYVGGKWITDDWFVAYNHRTLADELENTNEAESKYRLSKSWTLEGIAGTSEGGVDILWTKRWGK